MQKRAINVPLWLGFLLSVVAFLTYPFVFARWPVTRDVPWVNYILFAIAIVLLVAGVRRAQKKLIPSIVTAVGLAIALFFVLVITIFSKQIPSPANAPHVGQKVPQFTLLDTNRKPVALSQLMASAPRGVLLIFYRGYW